MVIVGILAACLVATSTVGNALACPFCSAVNLTFTEQLNSKDVVVVAELLELPEPSSDPDAELPKASMQITRVIKGDRFVKPGMKFMAIVVGRYPAGQKFLVMGVNPPGIDWTTPMKASERVFQYLEDIQKLPESGADRLAFFQDFLQDEESVLAFDAYDEFALAPYEDLIALKARMPRQKLLEWINDPETSVNRRRLYLTMLGVCGNDDDAETLRGFIESGDRKQRAGLDALVASYLTLAGDKGVELIEREFLKNPDVDYVDTLAAVSALRFHGSEVEIISRDRIVRAVRTLLDRPKLADMIIPDLARWEDWSVIDRLVKMFKEADEDSNWLRVPVISYLNECPKPEAKAYLAELEKIDPDAVRRAAMFSSVFDEFDDDADDETDVDDADDDETESSASPDETSAGQSTTASDTQFVSIQSDGFRETTSGQSDRRHTVRRVSATDIGEDTKVALSGLPTVADKDSDDTEATETAEPDAPEANNPDPSNVAETVIAESFTRGQPDQLLKESDSTPDAVARNLPAAETVPVAATQPVYNLTLAIILVPMASSVLIFALLWSVVNGWFERLIF